MPQANRIYHFALPDDWISGSTYAPPSLEREGFIHLSTRAQLLPTLERYFTGTSSLLLIEVAADLVTAELRYEEAHGTSFPHLYGPLNPGAVIATHTLVRKASGSFELPDTP